MDPLAITDLLQGVARGNIIGWEDVNSFSDNLKEP
jgi:hypothetical protein